MASLVGSTGDDALTGFGGNEFFGMAGNDVLTGGVGNDRFDFDNTEITGASDGIDIMIGGGGDDMYYVDDAGDQVVEVSNLGGIDTVVADVSYTLSNNVDNLTLDTGGANGTGNNIVNTITGNDSDNTLDGRGGADTLDGGAAGNDVYVVDNLGDVVIEVGTDIEEIDGVVSTIAFDLSLVPHLFIENITLTGVSAINATGNELSNTMIGNNASNVLDGGTTADPDYLLEGFADDYLDGGLGADIMTGRNGSDTYVVDNAGDVINELVGEGSDTVKSSITINMNGYVNVENVILTGTNAINATAHLTNGNAITGNSARNTLTGGNADDILNGGGGNDRMVGGNGDDTFLIDASGDTIIENAAGGNDTVIVFTSFSLSSAALAGQEIENLTMAGSAVFGTGNSLVNIIVGNNLSNTIDGGAGADSMAGGDGDDIYIVDASGDFVDEILDQGNDTVQSTLTYTLTTFVENLVLLGTSAINGTGNDFVNTITGNVAVNSLDGGVGADTLIGGNGNDVYLIDDVGDVIIEGAAGGAADNVISQVTYTLSANVENLQLTGGIDIDGTGNASANTIIGNGANNTLDGGGGADNLQGGLGDDYYIVTGAGSVIVEAFGAGNDTVESSVSFVLGANIESLVLTGSADITGTGETGVNTITGNTGNNTLDGALGADIMAGGFGDDTYVIDDAGDDVDEALSQGDDTILSSVTIDLSAGVFAADEIENVALTGVAALNATGNDLSNTLTGNSAANVLTGGLGDDTYIVDLLDTVVEALGAGTDTVLFAGTAPGQTYTLSGNIENLTLTGGLAIHGTGDGGDNTITGNSAVNTLAGGLGDDTYFIGAGDVVLEAIGEGTDTVVTSATTSLASFGVNEIENLILIGTANISGTGDGTANAITGNTGNNTLTGLAGNDTLDGGGGLDTLIGGADDDLYIVDSTTDIVTEAVGGGADTVQSSATFTLGANVEDLTLTGLANINATGNALVNVLTGNAGDNTLDGLAGADFMIGGGGNDTFIVDDAGDSVIDASGTDTIRTNLTYTLAALPLIENLTLTGTTNINGTGNNANNTLTGNGGVNILTGGLGDDTYIMNSNDTAVELFGEGNDTLIVTITSGSFIVPANFENIILIGNGNVGLTGDGGSNTLTGNNGNNTLDGGGGADFLAGGRGGDVYIVDDAGDTVQENAGEGTDTIRSSVTYTLPGNVEHLLLTGTADIDGTGNGGDNTITGNSGDNTLDGGLGTDRLVGGLGDDSYIIDNNRDVIVDSGGHDTVYAPYSYTLAAALEDLVLTGTDDLNGTGSAYANAITGNDGDNLLSGLGGNDILTGGDGDDSLVGGTGLDNMTGGDGDDAYFVDNAGDIVVELANEGSDIVTLNVSYVFDPTAEIEFITLSTANPLNLTATDTDNFILANVSANRISSLDGDDIVFGGGGADSIDAGAGDDTIIGGSGQDTIRGGAGADTFIMLGGFATGNVADVIQDFNVSTDNDVLDIADFLAGYDPLNDVLTDFVRIQDSGGNTLVQVDANGTALPGGFVTIAILQSITGLTGEAALVASGNLIVS